MGKVKGDLILNVKVLADARLWYDQGELHLLLPVRPLEAFEGQKVAVSTPGGNVTVKLPPRAKNGAKLRLRGKGATRGKKAGDLIVHIEVVLPEDEDALEAIKAVDEALGDRDVRGDLPNLS